MILISPPMKYITLFFLCGCSAVLAAKAPVKSEPFTVRPTLSATALPDAALPISVDARQWGVFTIVEIVPHGSAVKKDQVLVRFDDEDFLKKLRGVPMIGISHLLRARLRARVCPEKRATR